MRTKQRDTETCRVIILSQYSQRQGGKICEDTERHKDRRDTSKGREKKRNKERETETKRKID